MRKQCVRLIHRSISSIMLNQRHELALSTRPVRSVEALVDDILQLRNFSSASALDKELNIYASKKQTPVSLRSLMETGNGDRLGQFDEMMKGRFSGESNVQSAERILIQVACFLHREMPIRLAQRAMKLEASPIFQRSGEE
jgi:hypothetical protein